MSITTEAKNEVERLIRQGQKLMAIKYLGDTFNISLPEAKMLVEAVEKEQSSSGSTQPTSSQVELSNIARAEVISLLMANKKIEAVKKVKTQLGIGLKEALDVVEEIERGVNPNYRSVKVNSRVGVFQIVGLIFGFVGALFVAVAGIVYYNQSKTLENSEKTMGTVVDFRIQGSGSSAPVIAYKWKNHEKLYYSNTYSTPAAYDMSEQVELFVNRDDPGDVVVDTFSDRWILIVIFGGLGSFFVLFSALLLFVGRKF
jgi:ribosomal protein L7/L12